jgi:hypothetical protein
MDYERKITTKWTGSVIRKKLGLQTQRSRDGYLIPLAEKEKLTRLYEKYGIGREDAEPSVSQAE